MIIMTTIKPSLLRFFIVDCFIHIALSTSSPLSDVFHSYEPVDYLADDLLRQHTASHGDITFLIKSKLRTFNLTLKSQNNVLSKDVIVEVDSSPYPIDKGMFYVGKIRDETSAVFGIITSTGHFHGQIRTHNDTLFMEPVHHYVTTPQPFHSILYRSSDVKYRHAQSRCNADKLRQSLKFKVLNDESTEEDSDVKYHTKNEYTYEANVNHKRSKRSTPIASKTVCELYLQADHLYYQKYGSNADTVIEHLNSYVQAVNAIFHPIDFDKDGSADKINFIVKRLKIYTNANEAGYKFPSSHYSVEKFLDIHSETNYDDFCLSYMFTDRDFDGGVLGLAWVASLSSSGGVCEKFKTYSGGEQKSLNTGIVTVQNYGKSVASVVTQVTFAHEIGHNFGSEHDTDGTTCAPGGTSGNYIMYSKATSGYLPNNDDFSQCSIDQIGPILTSKARSSSGCFTAPTGNICGNKIVESGEECDCGWDDECQETCCNPQATGASNACTFKNPSNSANFCSPSQGPCCSDTCQYKQTSENFVCRQNTSCMTKAVCDGTGYTCPASTPVANGTSCSDGQVCYLGECSGSVCLANGYPSCQCPGSSISDTSLCNLCCEDNGVCKSASELPAITETKSFPGSPCFNYQGYCDVFYVCREVDPSGPLNNIRKLLLSGEVLDTVKEFLTKHWYVGLAGGLALVIILGLIIKCCSKTHGPPKDKSKSTAVEKLGRTNRVAPSESYM